MALKFGQLVQEDVNVGTSRVWIQAPAGGKARATQVGIHTPARNQKASTSTWNPGAIADGASATTTLTVTNATAGDFVMASHSKILTSGLSISGHVSASDTVKVVIANHTGSSVTVASGTLRVVVFPATGQTESACVPPTASFTYETNGTTATFTDASTGTVTSWSWDFGDQNTSSEQNPEHQYGATGDFDVVLTVTSSCGSDDYEDTVTIGE